ncbi:HlyD family secretion protein [Meinhardsimonia xiamenensis]|jgi:multidrug efflux pump subunit AcrA (membrane-fusion protein)|uniref:HlyD family secretion protein n=1 Tax=Meinhardsimonia xiamenensis TaxID=990712 RepID=A0A1G9ACC3_9RHOB|nr:HlyD family efflux transporter periplasmic adaptor subunit [Meinhardsimonia xiamenensis]PRX35447.1 HlyD family secretion protein [Meinhardsimonia xiamenensis]SDK24883.1 HlyD family secretion protein [Meinhardsimonia xiamenensis]
MRFLRRTLVGLFLAALTAGLLALAGDLLVSALQARWAKEDRPFRASERVFAVDVVRVEPGRVTPVITSFGEIRSRRALDLRAAAGGPVIAIGPNFEEGGRVEAGELLFAIDPADAEAARDVARTDLAEAEAELAEATRAVTLAGDDLQAALEQEALRVQALERQKSLLARGVGTEAAVEAAALAAASAKQAVVSRRQALAQAEARVDQARTALERRRIALAEAERRVAETEARAEFAGTLADVTLVEGAIIQAGERVARLIDAAALEVAFRLSAQQYARLLGPDGRLLPAHVSVSLEVLGLDITASGRISRESAVVGEGQTGRQLFATLEAARGFRPGDFVTVTIEEPELEGVALLPATAVDGAGRVLVVGEGERLEVAQVEVLRRQGDAVIVAAGALAGREVVARRSPLLGEGIRVRPLRDTGEEAPPPEPEMLELSEERRARLIAFIQSNERMPREVKERLVGQLSQPKVPAAMVARLESRMGG